MKSLGGELLCQKDPFLCTAMGTQLGIAFNKKIGSGLFGGEGLFIATLEGHGSVWLQSMPFARLAQRITSMYSSGKGEGSVIGGVANIFGD